MERKEKITLLTDWAVAYKNLEKSFDDMEVLMGCSVAESDIFNAAWKTFELYTKAIAVILAEKKDTVHSIEEWLAWFCYENKMGEGEMTAKAESWKGFRKIKNLNILLKVIEE